MLGVEIGKAEEGAMPLIEIFDLVANESRDHFQSPLVVLFVGTRLVHTERPAARTNTVLAEWLSRSA